MRALRERTLHRHDDAHTAGRHAGDPDRLIDLRDPADPTQPVVVRDVRRFDTVGTVARLAAMAAGMIVAGFGLVALLGIDWSVAEVDRPAVEVAGLAFVPLVAGVTAVLGILLVVSAASHSDSRQAVGAVAVTLGLVVLLVDLEPRWQVAAAHGWLVLLAGAALLLSGLVTGGRYLARRRAV